MELNHTTAAPSLAARHYQWRLRFETDPADVHAAISAGADDLVLLDTRSADDFAQCHIDGAVSFPHRDMNSQSLAQRLDPAKRYVTYCWSPGCNAATKGAMAVASAGFRVQEMLGGIEYWQREGLPTASSQQAEPTPPAVSLPVRKSSRVLRGGH